MLRQKAEAKAVKACRMQEFILFEPSLILSKDAMIQLVLPKVSFEELKVQDPSAKRRITNSSLLQAINYARLLKIVRRHLKFDSIANRKTNESLPHFST
jgi:hypothetical protein